MFQLSPNDKQGWLRALILPFQAYVVAAFVVKKYYIGHYGGYIQDFGGGYLCGLFVCSLVLLCIGTVQMFTQRLFHGLLNISLGAFAGWLVLTVNYVRA
jgi:hypothetical protein